MAFATKMNWLPTPFQSLFTGLKPSTSTRQQSHHNDQKQQHGSTSPTMSTPSTTTTSSNPIQPIEEQQLYPTTSTSTSQTATQNQTHLIIAVNGLFGSPANWRVIAGMLRDHLNLATTLIHVSEANQFTATYDGIDVCGSRLAEEIRGIVEKQPQLERLSVVAHSMGGLISRCALGKMYEPESGRIAGLKPTHFIALATPHVGVSPQAGLGEVPLISWAGHVPLGIGTSIFQPILRKIAPHFSAVSFNTTGRQFFLIDGNATTPPLMYRLARDVPGEGYFYSALHAFDSRTAYGNASGDHLVNWSQSTVRSVQQLPVLKNKGKGVVREDSLLTAWHPQSRTLLKHHPIAQGLHASEALESRPENIIQAASPEKLAELDSEQQREIVREGVFDSVACSPPCGDSVNGIVGTSDDGGGGSNNGVPSTSATATTSNVSTTIGAVDTEELLADNLRQLQTLPWRRVDVCFGRSLLPLLAHQHLQVQRKWLNWAGLATAKHIALQFVALEELRVARDEAVAAAAEMGKTKKEEEGKKKEQEVVVTA